MNGRGSAIGGSPGSAAAVVAIVVGVVFLRALWCDFVNFDDPGFVVNNLLIRNLDRDFLVRAFTEPYVDFWLPLVWVSYALEYRVWGLDPMGYHLTNIVLHAANAGVVALIAGRVCRLVQLEDGSDGGGGRRLVWAPLLAGLLFGIHPLRVESVAWVTERKDVLNGLFTFGSILWYLRYAEKKRRNPSGFAAREYLVCFLLFACSLTAKSISVVVPAMMLVADWYPLDRFRREDRVRVVMEKAPFLALSLLVSLLTIHFASQGELLTPYGEFPLLQRLIVSGNAIFEYCRLMLFPVGILPYYFIPSPLPAEYAVKCAATAVFTGYCVYAGTRKRGILAVWLLFVIPLLPVLAFLQNGGEQSMAARFTYLPSVAPVIAVALLIERTVAGGRGASWAGWVKVGTAVLLLWHAVMTVSLIGVWQDTGTLWSRVLERTPLGRAYLERGMHYFTTGDHGRAIADLTSALDIGAPRGVPGLHNMYAFRAEAFRLTGRHHEAVKDYGEAIALYPHRSYYAARAASFAALGMAREAEADRARAGADAGPVEWIR